MKYKQMAFDTPIHKLVEVPVDYFISDSDCVKIVI